MRARLFTRTGELAGASFEIGAEATIGRAADNQIVLPGGLVSARHARIAFDPGQACYRLEDLGSRNGTLLNGSRLSGAEALGRLEVITFAGAFDFVFQLLDASAEPSVGTVGNVGAELASARVEASSTPTQKPESAPPAGGTRVDMDGPALPAALLPPGAARGGTVVERDAPVLPAALAAAARGGGTVIEGDGPPLPSVLVPGMGPAAPQPQPPGVAPPTLPPPLAPPAAVPPPPSPPLPRSATLVERAAPPGLPPGLAAAAQAAAAVAPPSFALRLEHPAGPEVVDLPPGEHLVGRAEECAVAIDDQGLSRRHARLRVADDRVTVTDLGSTNHTYAAGKKLLPDVETPVAAGTEIVFGAFRTVLLRRSADGEEAP